MENRKVLRPWDGRTSMATGAPLDRSASTVTTPEAQPPQDPIVRPPSKELIDSVAKALARDERRGMLPFTGEQSSAILKMCRAMGCKTRVSRKGRAVVIRNAAYFALMRGTQMQVDLLNHRFVVKTKIGDVARILNIRESHAQAAVDGAWAAIKTFANNILEVGIDREDDDD